ncbi:MAG TPA: methyltransferase, partial [Candidatus Caenarcaniphilales bacterium]|nr:methyltransferase [Candidatus Caenarcaniphilales bacterium]
MSRLPALGQRGEGWFALQLVLLVAVAAAGVFLPAGWSGPLAGAVAAAGVALVVAGVSLAVAGSRDLDTALSPLPRPAEGAKLVEHGVYRHVRHPIYLGLSASALGWALVMASLVGLLLALLLSVLLGLKARREEAWL